MGKPKITDKVEEKQQEVESSSEEKPTEISPERWKGFYEDQIKIAQSKLDELSFEANKDEMIKEFPQWKVEIEKAISDLQRYVKEQHYFLNLIADKIKEIEAKVK